MANGLLGLSRNQLMAAAGGLLGQGFSRKPRSGFEGFGAALKGAQKAGEQEDEIAQRFDMQQNRLDQASELAKLRRDQSAKQFSERAAESKRRFGLGAETRALGLQKMKAEIGQIQSDTGQLAARREIFGEGLSKSVMDKRQNITIIQCFPFQG